jgi:hypothetical protein
MGENESSKSEDPQHHSGVMGYDEALRSKRELTPENLDTAADLIDVSMQILKSAKIDGKTGIRTAFVMTRKMTGSNFLNRQSDPNGDRFYVKIIDLKAGDKFPNLTKDLIIHYRKTHPGLAPISEDSWNLPRDKKFAKDTYLWDLRGGKLDWTVINELTQDLKTNYKFHKRSMFITEEQYESTAKS